MVGRLLRVMHILEGGHDVPQAFGLPSRLTCHKPIYKALAEQFLGRSQQRSRQAPQA